MMEQLVKRGEQIAREAEQAKVSRIAARLRELIGDLSVDGSRITVSGRGLFRRWLADSRLRFIGSELR